ncbi:MAG: HepT-like ribonuclease domain-containing protein [Rhodanobacter sp.]
MIGFADKVLAYTDGMDQAAFAASALTYDATLRNLELIGEAASRIPVEVREQHTHIPWRLLTATRNRLIHAYLGIDDDAPVSAVLDVLPQDHRRSGPAAGADARRFPLSPSCAIAVAQLGGRSGR